METQGFLLDTNAVLSMAFAPSSFPKKTAQKLDSTELPVFHTLINFWEIAIKRSKGGFIDLNVPPGWRAYLSAGFRERSIGQLDLSPKDCESIEFLPHHHRDPFDRMIIAQALNNDLTVITADRHFPAYGVKTLW